MKRTTPLLAVLLLGCGLPDESPNHGVVRGPLNQPPSSPFDPPVVLTTSALEPIPGWQEKPRPPCSYTFVYDSEQAQTYQGVDCLVVVPRRAPRALRWSVDYPIFNEAGCASAEQAVFIDDELDRRSRPQWLDGRCVVNSFDLPNFELRNAIVLTGVNLARLTLTLESR